MSRQSQSITREVGSWDEEEEDEEERSKRRALEVEREKEDCETEESEDKFENRTIVRTQGSSHNESFFSAMAKANKRISKQKMEEAGRIMNNLTLMASSQEDGAIPAPPLTSTQSEKEAKDNLEYMFHKEETVKELLEQNMNPADFPRKKNILKKYLKDLEKEEDCPEKAKKTE